MNNTERADNRIRGILLERIRKSKISHAYIFSGGDEELRSELCRWFASALLCTSEEVPCGECLSCRKILHGNHEDLIIVSKGTDRQSISVEQISGLVDKLSLKPIGKRYVVLIENAELMTAASQNKLLKTLEEPVSDAVIILSCNKADSMLQTVLSRCVAFHINTEAEDPDEELRTLSEKYAKLMIINAPYFKRKDLIASITADKENGRLTAVRFLDLLEEQLRNALISGSAALPAEKFERISDLIRETEICKRNLRQLHSVPWSLKQLCLK